MSECSDGSSPGGSPVAPPAPRKTAGQKRKAPAKVTFKPEPGSPSMPPQVSDSEDEDTALVAASHAARPVSSQEGEMAKRVVIAPVPSGPPPPNGTALLSTHASIGPDETYSKDEETLNTFMKLHPMLSLEACSGRTLQMVADMVEKANIQCEPLPEVPKSHDDLMLRPPCEEIGERPCINGEKCLARFIAQVRYGRETDLAFTCTEFLLPDQRRTFLDGHGLPARHGKCLLCMRYFQVHRCAPHLSQPLLSPRRARARRIMCTSWRARTRISRWAARRWACKSFATPWAAAMATLTRTRRKRRPRPCPPTAPALPSATATSRRPCSL